MSDIGADDVPKEVKPLRIEVDPPKPAEKPKASKSKPSKKEADAPKESSKTQSSTQSSSKAVEPQENPELDEVNPYDDEEERILGENKHIAEYADTKIDIKLGDPVLRSSGAFSKDYIDYAISGTDKKGKFHSNRRYKEFELLRTKLVEVYPLFFVPGLPEKKVVNNTEPEFVKERQRGLEHFVFRLSRLTHLWYSTEVQHFVRSKDQFTSFMTASTKPTYQAMYERNRQLFADCDAEPTEEQLNLALRQFPMVKHWAGSFKVFEGHTRVLLDGIKKERFLRSKMISFAFRDYAQKISSKEVVKKAQDKVDHLKAKFGVSPTQPAIEPVKKLRTAPKQEEKEKSEITQSNFAEDLSKSTAPSPQTDSSIPLADVEQVWSNLYSRLAGIHTDLELFCGLEELFNANKTEIESMKTKSHSVTQQIEKVKSLNVVEIREGLFKFKSKDEKLKSLDKELKELQAEILAAEKNYSLMASALIKYQLPLLLYLKNTEVKGALKLLAVHRIEQNSLELELLRELHAHYKLY